jgi:hypothetical protein
MSRCHREGIKKGNINLTAETSEVTLVVRNSINKALLQARNSPNECDRGAMLGNLSLNSTL